MEKTEIEVKHIAMQIIYIRFTGSYGDFRKNSRKMVKELFAFAEKNQLINEKETKVLTIYHDNPFITKEENLKTSVAITVPLREKIVEEGRISSMKFSGKYAILHFNLKLNEYEKAWNWAYHDFLFKSESMKPRDDFPFELYVTQPPRNLKSKSLTDIYLPIE